MTTSINKSHSLSANKDHDDEIRTEIEQKVDQILKAIEDGIPESSDEDRSNKKSSDDASSTLEAK